MNKEEQLKDEIEYYIKTHPEAIDKIKELKSELKSRQDKEKELIERFEKTLIHIIKSINCQKITYNKNKEELIVKKLALDKIKQQLQELKSKNGESK